MPGKRDDDDLEALRAIARKARATPAATRSKSAEGLDGRRLRSAQADSEPRTEQLNTRVRAEIKRKALDIARHRRCTLAEAIETAIERLHADTIKP